MAVAPLFLSSIVAAAPAVAPPVTSIPACPTSVETLVAAMLPDLPGYINRILRRSRLNDDTTPQTYVLLAGNPEFEPLPLDRSPPEDVEQVFLTTLERTYGDRQAVELQHFHWLFLTRDAEGWWLVSMYSTVGSYPDSGVVTPPRETSQGAVARAIRHWLRDCRFREGNAST